MSATAPTADVNTAQRWWILGLLFACRAGLGLQFQTLGSVADPLVSALGLRYAEIGTLIGLFTLPGLLLALPAGYLGRHLSDRSLVSGALLCLAGGGALAALAHGFGGLAWGRLVAGLGFVFGTVYLTKMVADWFSGKELATAMGILVMSWPFGIAMGQVGHAWLAAHIDWRAAFWAASAYCLLGAGAIAGFYRSPGPARPPQRSPAGLLRSEWLLTVLAGSIWGMFNAGYIVYLSFAPQVLVAGGRAPTEAAAIISIASWVMIVSGALCGQIADRTGWRDRILYFCGSVAVATVLLLQQVAWAVPLSLLFGLIGAAPAGLIMALTVEAMAPQRRAFGMGVFVTVFFVFVTLAPPLAGWLFDRSGDPYQPLLLAAGLFAGAMAVFGLFRWAQRRLVPA